MFFKVTSVFPVLFAAGSTAQLEVLTYAGYYVLTPVKPVTE